MKRVMAVPVLALLISGCAATTPPGTQLQLRQIQTREYAGTDPKTLLKAVMYVLQDDGYIVRNGNMELGFINAYKELDVENFGEAVFLTLFGSSNSRWKKNTIYEVTANVMEYGAVSRVRMTFQMKMLDNKGAVMQVGHIRDPKFYQDFFDKVDKGVFIQKEKL